MPKFRKLPIVIEAEQWLGWTQDHQQEARLGLRSDTRNLSLITARIQTLEGEYTGNPGDWIITGITGERYPCQDAICRQTYAPVDDEARHALEE